MKPKEKPLCVACKFWIQFQATVCGTCAIHKDALGYPKMMNMDMSCPQFENSNTVAMTEEPLLD